MKLFDFKQIKRTKRKKRDTIKSKRKKRDTINDG